MTGGLLAAWWDGPADGPANMAADELLAEEADRRGDPVMRFYSWTTPTVSIGAFQRLEEAAACPAIAGLPIVRRPSGGGAILHGTDLTYAAAVPKSHPCGGAPQALYDAVHLAAIAVLGELGFAAHLHVPGGDDPPADALLCFSRRAPGDVVVRVPRPPAGLAADPKVLGSAQRRLGGTVLQHGSLLLSRAPAAGMAARHPGLSDLSVGPATWTPRWLADRWGARLAESFGGTLQWQAEAFATPRLVALTSRATRFLDPRWTARR
ncbi:MAG: biotin/lipoate A/B protein ligase family protein [Planctomycetota bacterium]|nr:hypothetical protein [Planctomycetota bacterium]